MKNFLYSQFRDSLQAERTIATLVDRGAETADLTGLFPLPHRPSQYGSLDSKLIPGLGLVTGSGSLATALSKPINPTVSVALAGGVSGFLENQGLPRSIAFDTARALKNGSAILAVACPTGRLEEFEVMEILSKYQAQTFARSQNARKVIYAL